jgi:hypothetical protein
LRFIRPHLDFAGIVPDLANPTHAAHRFRSGGIFFSTPDDFYENPLQTGAQRGFDDQIF